MQSNTEHGHHGAGRVVAQPAAAVLGQSHARTLALALSAATAQLIGQLHELGTAGRADGVTLAHQPAARIDGQGAAQGRDAIAAFAEAIRERPEVLDCYTTMGEWDFMLRIVTKDIKAYEAFYLDHLSKLPNVQSINSSVTVTVIKETTVLPID